MDIVFNCQNCKQELAVEESAAGQEIECPSCREVQMVPDPKAPAPKEPEPAPALESSMVSHSAHKPRQLAVPQRDTPSESLVKKAAPKHVPGQKIQLRTKCIKRIACVEVGHDKFDEVVAEFIAEVGDINVVSLHPLSYAYVDSAGRIMADYGVLIVYKG